MLNEMRSKNSRKRKSQVKKTSSKPKAEYLKRDYGTKDQMLMRWKENDPSSTSKDPNIVKDGTLQYQLWGGRYVLFCTICLCPVSAHKVKTQRHLDASKASNSHQVRMREVREKRLFLVDLYKHGAYELCVANLGMLIMFVLVCVHTCAVCSNDTCCLGHHVDVCVCESSAMVSMWFTCVSCFVYCL
jgi:hypothetical protein